MKSSKTKNLFFSIAILAIAIVAFGWYYLATRPVSIELQSDKTAYFKVDMPVVEVMVNNLKDADNGQIAVTYDNSVLELSETMPSEGVTYNTLGNTVIFELSKDYVASGENKAGEITFESTSQGTVDLVFDADKTYVNNKDGEMELSLKEVSFEIGVAPREAEENANEQDSNDPNEL